MSRFSEQDVAELRADIHQLDADAINERGDTPNGFTGLELFDALNELEASDEQLEQLATRVEILELLTVEAMVGTGTPEYEEVIDERIVRQVVEAQKIASVKDDGTSRSLTEMISELSLEVLIPVSGLADFANIQAAVSPLNEWVWSPVGAPLKVNEPHSLEWGESIWFTHSRALEISDRDTIAIITQTQREALTTAHTNLATAFSTKKQLDAGSNVDRFEVARAWLEIRNNALIVSLLEVGLLESVAITLLRADAEREVLPDWWQQTISDAQLNAADRATYLETAAFALAVSHASIHGEAGSVAEHLISFGS